MYRADAFGAILSHIVHFCGTPIWTDSICFFKRYLLMNDAWHIVHSFRCTANGDPSKAIWCTNLTCCVTPARDPNPRPQYSQTTPCDGNNVSLLLWTYLLCVSKDRCDANLSNNRDLVGQCFVVAWRVLSKLHVCYGLPFVAHFTCPNTFFRFVVHVGMHSQLIVWSTSHSAQFAFE